MKINQFEDIVSWKKSQALALEIYKELKELRDYSFKDQICRASVSISNNSNIFITYHIREVDLCPLE